jgi:hypothetical protein
LLFLQIKFAQAHHSSWINNSAMWIATTTLQDLPQERSFSLPDQQSRADISSAIP